MCSMSYEDNIFVMQFCTVGSDGKGDGELQINIDSHNQNDLFCRESQDFLLDTHRVGVQTIHCITMDRNIMLSAMTLDDDDRQ